MEARPAYWVVETPRAMLRTVIGKPLETVFLCSWGDTRQKLTDLWGEYALPLARPCAPHAAAPRGGKTPGSTNGLRHSASRAKLPFQLAHGLAVGCRGTGSSTVPD